MTKSGCATDIFLIQRLSITESGVLSATALSFGTKLNSSTNDQFANVAPLLVILYYGAFLFK